jgi:phosphoglycerate dehydrogenase-like enzyme
VDVWETEPPSADSPLLTLPPPVADRVLFTPHIAGVAYEAAQTLYTRAWDNVRSVLIA